MSFFAIRCNKCGNWVVSEVNNILSFNFKCRRCNKTQVLKPKRKYGLNQDISKPFNTPEDAREFILSRTKEKDLGFYSYKRKN